MNIENRIKNIKKIENKNVDRYKTSYEKYCHLREKGLTKKKPINSKIVVSNISVKL